MEDKKEERKDYPKNLLEEGKYLISGPDNGDIVFDKIELNAASGAKRVWKVEEFSKEKIVLKVLKFG